LFGVGASIVGDSRELGRNEASPRTFAAYFELT
jgi:hypothetical protein